MWGLLFLLCAYAVFAPAAEARRPARERAGTGSESPDDETLEQAHRALAAARTALAGRNAREAYRSAVEAFRMARLPEALLMLGKVALAEGRSLDAQDLMRRYLADPNLESAPGSPEQLAAERIAEQPYGTAAKLTISGDRGTLVLIDGRLVGALPLSRPLLLSPSSHKVELLRGKRSLEDEVRVPAGRHGELRSDLKTKALLLSVLPGVVVLNESSSLQGPDQLRFFRAVEEAVQAERLSPVAQEVALEVAGEPAPGPCADERRCLIDLAAQCEADYVLRTSAKQKAAAWQLSMELFDVGIGDVAARSESQCEKCGIEQAVRQLAGLFGPLYGQASGRARGQLTVRSNPPGAEVLLDGQLVGRTPYQATAWAGPRELVLRKTGHIEEHRQITVPDGDTTELELSLPPRAAPTPAPPAPAKAAKLEWRRQPRPLWRLSVGAAGIAAGLLLGGFGSAALYLDGKCTQPPPGNSVCPILYDTLTPGLGLTVSGAVLLGAGTALMAWPGPRRQVQVSAPQGALFGLALSY